MAISAYDDNQFAYRKPTRIQSKMGAQRKMRRHLPLWLDGLLIVVLVAVASGVGYVLTHPSAHRSPSTIATDFVFQIGSGNYTAADADVDPVDRAAALTTMRTYSGIPGGALAGTHATKVASQIISGTAASVVLQACNGSLACNNLPAIPCVEVDGQWYVAWNLLLRSLAA